MFEILFALWAPRLMQIVLKVNFESKKTNVVIMPVRIVG